MRIEIKTDGGKYTYQFTHDGKTQILRYGKEWRNETGDGALLSLMQYAEELEAKVKKFEDIIDELQDRVEGIRRIK